MISFDTPIYLPDGFYVPPKADGMHGRKNYDPIPSHPISQLAGRSVDIFCRASAPTATAVVSATKEIKASGKHRGNIWSCA